MRQESARTRRTWTPATPAASWAAVKMSLPKPLGRNVGFVRQGDEWVGEFLESFSASQRVTDPEVQPEVRIDGHTQPHEHGDCEARREQEDP